MMALVFWDELELCDIVEGEKIDTFGKVSSMGFFSFSNIKKITLW